MKSIQAISDQISETAETSSTLETSIMATIDKGLQKVSDALADTIAQIAQISATVQTGQESTDAENDADTENESEE